MILVTTLTACVEDNNTKDGKSDDTVNLKSVAVQGDWVYHFKRDRSISQATPGLYKTKLDNSETALVTEDLGLFLILEGDWIYYSNITQDSTDAIYKIKTDGTEKTKLIDDSIMASMSGKGFELDGEWLYYLSKNEEGSLHRVKTDGSHRENIGEGYIYDFDLTDDWIYINIAEDGPRLYKMKKDGSERNLIIEENAVLMYASDNYIYFSDESGDNLKKSNLDGSDVKILNIDNIYLLKTQNDSVYYITQPKIPEPDNQLYRAKNDGKDITKLTDDDSFFMEIEGDWIYYISMDEESNSFKLNKIKTDGSEKELFKAEGILVFLNW